jgi:signal transduction histidine kinase
MKLAAFIQRDMEAILCEWESFARGLPAGASMDVAALRDHARQILDAVCKDIVLEQTAEERTLKSRGAARPLDARETAAQTHALLRARSGFDVNEMASEYRALRASVLRLWADACAPASIDIDQTIRFNEAIDQALCESILFFSADVERARDLFLGILGHDLRNPLNAIQLTARHLQRLNAGEQVSAAARRLMNSGASMKALLDDLTDFNRTRLGLGIVVSPTANTDLAAVLGDEVEAWRAANPGREIVLDVEGDVRGSWDGIRLQQVVRNLVQNGLRYGSADRPIRIHLSGSPTELSIKVENEGQPIPDSTLAKMFEPLRRGAERPDQERLGLGLFICREIARSHGGSITAESSDRGTVFLVRIPREATA